MTSKLDAALALAARGFNVFPLKPGAKAPPLVNDWPRAATDNPARVNGWWMLNPNANIGLHADGFIIIDVDVKKGGDASLALLELTYGLPDTLTTVTPSGGRHLFYRHPEPVHNSVDVLGAGLDVRSAGGYVVAPGSEVPAGRYRFERDVPIAAAPDWLVAKLGQARPSTERAGVAEVPDASPEVLERAREWLGRQEGAVEGRGGDARTFAVACGLRDMGVSEGQAAALLIDDYNPRCAPPWAPDELSDKAANAYRYAQNDPGSAVARPEDFPLMADPLPARPRPRVARLDELAASETKGPGYLVKGLLQRRSYAETFGAPGEGKTFVALDIAYCVAADTPWMGRKVHTGPVLYLAFEGQGGLVKRAQALRQRYGHKEVPLYVASAAFSLREPAGRKELGGIIADLPGKPVLIVIDTFARALMGGDENSAQDVGAFNSAIVALIESTGACVMIVHHSGKNKAAGARGSSALQGAIDTEIEVDGGKVTANKQRDMETGEPIGFKLVPLVVGVDEDNDEVTSCVVEPDAVAAGPQGKLSGNAKRGFDVLCEIRPDNGACSESEWRDACVAFLGSKSLAQRFYDIKKSLRAKGYVMVDEKGLVTRRIG